MVTLAYPVDLAPDEGNTVMATLPDFDAAVTYGDNREEALQNVSDLLETIVSHWLAEGRDLPRPSATRDRPVVMLPALAAAKTLLNLELRAAGISKAELARRLGWHMPQVMRVLDLRHKSNLEQIEAALHALGKSLVLGVRDAA